MLRLWLVYSTAGRPLAKECTRRKGICCIGYRKEHAKRREERSNKGQFWRHFQSFSFSNNNPQLLEAVTVGIQASIACKRHSIDSFAPNVRSAVKDARIHHDDFLKLRACTPPSEREPISSWCALCARSAAASLAHLPEDSCFPHHRGELVE